MSVHATEGVLQPLTGLRRAAAKHMIAAWQVPAFHLGADVTMEAALEAKRGIAGATLTDVIIAATALALSENPGFNGWYEDMSVRTFSTINIAIAVATEAGLMVPVLHDILGKSLAEIAEARREIVARARQGALTRADITGGTFTISNLGGMGIDRFDAIINVPQIAILAVPSLKRVIRDEEGELISRSIAELTLTCDHRAVDGAAGARFLHSLRSHLENPRTL